MRLSTSASALLLASLAATAAAQGQSEQPAHPRQHPPQPAEEKELNFTVDSGNYRNFFWRTNLTSATVLVTTDEAARNGTLNRFLVAQPAGNSGSVAYFLADTGAAAPNATADGAGNSTTTATSNPLVVGLESLSTAAGPNNHFGVQGVLNFTANATLGTTLLGSIRTVRDFVEGNGVTHDVFNWTFTQLDPSVVWFSRRWINESTVLLPDGTQTKQQLGLEWRLDAQNGTTFEVAPSTNGTYTPPSVKVVVPEGATGSVSFVTTTNETVIPGLPAAELFNPAINATDDADAEARRSLSFLTFREKLTAGSWRFLTYFGRDTLFTTKLLFNKRLMSPVAIESVLSAAIERINATEGFVCHEETIGDYASFVNAGNGRPELGNQPFYDYKMVDTHFLLLPVLRDYLLLYNATSAQASTAPNETEFGLAFLDRNATLQNGTSYRQLLDANVNLVLNLTSAFAKEPNVTNLVRFGKDISGADLPVGNWRDSNPGTGYGRIAFDVNVAHVPAALYAIADLADANLLNSTLANQTRQAAQTWETRAPTFFRYNITEELQSSRLAEYVQSANLSESLLYGKGSLNGTQGAELSTSANSSFFALSLLDDGTPVDVQHSDLAFPLLLNRNISRELVVAAIRALEPYPRGLTTNIGTLVANPALSSNRTNVEVFDRRAYHGTVSWSWITTMFAEGISRALSACNQGGNGGNSTATASNGTTTTTAGSADANSTSSATSLNSTVSSADGNSVPLRSEWCDDVKLVDQLSAAEYQIWNSILGAADQKYSEVWSWTYSNDSSRFTVTPLSALAPEGTESDAIQTWSYSLLGATPPAGLAPTNATVNGSVSGGSLNNPVPQGEAGNGSSSTIGGPSTETQTPLPLPTVAGGSGSGGANSTTASAKTSGTASAASSARRRYLADRH